MMKPFVSYLFARGAEAGAPVPCVTLRCGDPAPATLTVLLAANGLFARVVTPALRAILPLIAFDDGDAVRGLDVRAAVLAPIPGAASPLTPVDLPGLAFAVARQEGRSLPIAVGYGRAAEPGDPLTYVVAATGVYAAYTTPVYTARVRIAAIPPGLDLGLDPVEEGVALRVPRVPAALLHQIVAQALAITRVSGHEALWQLRWDDDAGWTVTRPAQDTAPGHVGYVPDGDPAVLLTIHSHGRHPTYWSRTDDVDELGCGFNAVVGDLGDGLRSARLLARVSVFGYRLALPAAALFDGLLPIADGLTTPPPRGTRRRGRDDGPPRSFDADADCLDGPVTADTLGDAARRATSWTAGGDTAREKGRGGALGRLVARLHGGAQ